MTHRYLSLLAALCLPLATVGHASKPNILFIFADDMTYDAVAALGNKEIETPNLDRLVRSGTTFTHAYNSGSWSGAVCVASRNMLITGHQLWNAQRLVGNKEKHDAFVAAGKTWPQLMSKGGYRTYMTGKWHVKAKAEEIFDVTNHVRPGMPKTVPESYNRPIDGQPDPWDPADKSVGGFWEGGRHWSEVGADDAVGFLQEASKSDQPFFIYLAFNAPHDPRQAPQEFLDKYPAAEVKIPESYLERYPYCEEIGCSPKLRDEKLAPFPRTHHAVQVHRREYYAIITHMDAQIGRVLDALEKSGKKDETHIVFTADHGLGVGKHGLFGKQNMYDHSVRVPFIVAGPGVAEGARNDAPIYLQDVVPTTLDWAGLKTPEHIQFESIQPHLAGKGTKRKAIYGGYLGVQRSITAGGYKLIIYPEAGVKRLYHVRRDPHELADLLEQPTPEATSKAESLGKRFLKLRESCGDTLEIKL